MTVTPRAAAPTPLGKESRRFTSLLPPHFQRPTIQRRLDTLGDGNVTSNVGRTGSLRGFSTRTRSCKPDPITDSFDWYSALKLAGASFEAYADLDSRDLHLSKVTPNNTRISYLDADFLESAYVGVIKVEILSASLVSEKQWWNPFSLDTFKGDPYVIASIDGGISRTDTRWTEQSPVFDTVMHFFVKDKQSSRLLLRLMDDNVTLSDHELGKAFVPIGGLEEGRRHDFELPIGPTGTKIICAVTYAGLKDNEQIEDMVLAKEDTSEASQSVAQTLFASSMAVIESRWRQLCNERCEMFVPAVFIENDDSDTQVWIFWNKTQKEVCVAFRGTEQTEWRDVLSDLNLMPTNVYYDEGRIQKSDSTTDENEMWVHRGFLDAFLSVAAEIRETIVQQIGEKEPGQWTVFTTGHSLGGALSTLSAFELASKSNETGKFKAVINYSFGSPMVGNQAFCNAFNALVPICYRFANAKDAVTFVPRLIGFSHVGTKATLFDDGQVRFDDGKGVGESVTSEDIIKKMTYSKLKELAGEGYKEILDDALNKLLPTLASEIDGSMGSVDVDEILEAEKEALFGLIEGDGIDEHMEDVYWARLKDKVT